MLNSEQFYDLTFVEQMSYLYELQDTGDGSVCQHLQGLIQHCRENQALKSLIRDALQNVLVKDETEVIRGLKSSCDEYRQVCLQTICGCKLKTGLPVLHQMIRESEDAGLILDVLPCLASIMDPSSLPILRTLVTNPNEVVASLAIEIIGRFADATSLGLLFDLVDTSEEVKMAFTCDIRISKAIEAIGRIGGSESISFLLFKIHHHSPAIRCHVMAALENLGADTVMPFLKDAFQNGDNDTKVMIGDLIGRYKDKRGAEILADSLIQGHAQSDKVRLVVYQSLGNTHCLKSLVALMDGLSEPEGQLLHAVVAALDRNIGGGMTKSFVEKLQEDPTRKTQILRAIVGARAFQLFSIIFPHAELREHLIQLLLESRDSDSVNDFIHVIESLKTEEAKSALALLPARSILQTKANVLAVDDSKVILRFYRTVCSQLGLGVITAENGKEALQMLQRYPGVKLILADMNMPIMDGVEFTRSVRNHPILKKIPIVMVTTESEKPQMELAMQAGVSDFITKPFSQDEITQRIKDLWENKDSLPCR